MISTEEHYKIIFQNYQFVSEYRLKLIKGWALSYAALAATFPWFYSHISLTKISWVIPAIAIIITFLMWGADIRHRPSVTRSKVIGDNFEQDYIPENFRYFSDIGNGLPHKTLIDISAILALIAFGISILLLIYDKNN